MCIFLIIVISVKVIKMPRGKSLSTFEKGQICAWNSENIGMREIARRIGRSLCVVQNFLRCPESYGAPRRLGGKRKLSGRAENLLRRTASNSSVSLNDLRTVVSKKVSKSTVWRTLHRGGNICFEKKKMVQKLSEKHKKARVDFALNNVDRNWSQVIFSDEKKWNLDGPDGYRGYWRDTRKDPVTFSKRNFGGGSVMTWAAFCSEGTLEIQFVSSRMKSADYVRVLENTLDPFLRENDGMRWTFQQDNARIHCSRETMSWFSAKNIDVMKWPACSPDLNPMENLWGLLSQRVYKNNRQFDSCSQLISAIKNEWSKIEVGVITNLIVSMKTRIDAVLEKGGDVI